MGSGPHSEPDTGRAADAGPEQFTVVVIGGGPSGLAAGYELAKRSIDFVILEKGSRLGEDWRPRWDSFRVFTPARFDGLPGLPFHGEVGRHLTKDQMSEYLERYAERFRLPVRLGIDVPGLSLDEGGQVLVEWERGRLVADQVILATDEVGRLRSSADGDRRVIQLRAGEYRTLNQLSLSGVVVVVGGRSTASESGFSE